MRVDFHLHITRKILSIEVHRFIVQIIRGLTMALLSELVSTCAKHRLDTEPTLTVFARRLREAGRLSQAGRGRGAAHMTFLDGARFLIACAATDHPERAVDAELVFSNLVRSGGASSDKDFPLSHSEAPTLDLALANTLEAISNGTIDAIASARWSERSPGLPRLTNPFSGLRLPRGGSAAVLEILEGEYHYHHPALVALMASVDALNPEARQVAEEAFERETYRFRTAKNLVAQLNLEFLRVVADLIGSPRKGVKA